MQILRLENRLEWDLVNRQNLTAKPQPKQPYGVKSQQGATVRYVKGKSYNHAALLPLLFNIDKRIVGIGLIVNTNSNYSGCYATMRLVGKTSSTSKHQSGLLVYRQELILNELNVIQFPNITLSPYSLEISFARWINQVSLEVWKYIGIDTTSDIQALQQIQNTVNQISTNQI